MRLIEVLIMNPHNTHFYEELRKKYLLDIPFYLDLSDWPYFKGKSKQNIEYSQTCPKGHLY